MPGARRAAVLGHPIAHSLSPALHRAAYAALGLDGWTYEWVDVTAEQLPAFVAALDGSWSGLSLTMPLKHAVLPLLDHVEPLAEVVGAVNTVLVQPVGGGRTLVGANTDVYGLVTALREGIAAATAPSTGVPPTDGPETGTRTAAVLGGGATAASTLAALGELGVTSPAVYVRSLGRSGPLVRAAHRMGVEPRFRPWDKAAAEVGEADVVVATLPARGADELADSLPGHALRSLPGVLLDVAYEPRPTALSRAWARAGGVVVGGERMLLHQAAEQVRLMTGHPAPLDAMASALVSTLTAS